MPVQFTTTSPGTSSRRSTRAISIGRVQLRLEPAQGAARAPPAAPRTPTPAGHRSAADPRRSRSPSTASAHQGAARSETHSTTVSTSTPASGTVRQSSSSQSRVVRAQRFTASGGPDLERVPERAGRGRGRPLGALGGDDPDPVSCLPEHERGGQPHHACADDRHLGPRAEAPLTRSARRSEVGRRPLQALASGRPAAPLDQLRPPRVLERHQERLLLGIDLGRARHPRGLQLPDA